MGMFDYIQCDYDLPARPTYGHDSTKSTDGLFQTKDLENELFKYVVTKEGNLMLGKSFYDDECNENNIEYHLDPHTGWITFYTSEGHPLKDDYKWFEYRAEFFRGKLQAITGGITKSGRQRSLEECEKILSKNQQSML